MITTEPQIPDTAKLPIGKAAEVLGINRTTLATHVRDGYIRCGHYRHNKRKFFTGAEIKRYWRAHL